MRITPYEIWIILQIIRKPNPIIVFLFIWNNSFFKNLHTSVDVKFLSSTSSPGLLSCRPFFWRPQTFAKFWSALAGFEEIAVGFESFSFCSVETTVINLKWSVSFSLDQCSFSHRAFSLTWRASTPIYWKKESVYIRKEFNSHRIGLEHQHGRRFFFWNNNMAAVTSCENAILSFIR